MSSQTGFTGPKVNIEHAMLGREGNVVDGVVVSDKELGDAGSSSGGSGHAGDKKV